MFETFPDLKSIGEGVGIVGRFKFTGQLEARAWFSLLSSLDPSPRKSEKKLT